MSRKIIAVVLGATLMLGVVGVGAAPAGAQPTITPPSSLGALVTQINRVVKEINVVCSNAIPQDGYQSDSLNRACAQLPSLKLLVEQANLVCIDSDLRRYLC
jgi:hypothetical protein